MNVGIIKRGNKNRRGCENVGKEPVLSTDIRSRTGEQRIPKVNDTAPVRSGTDVVVVLRHTDEPGSNTGVIRIVFTTTPVNCCA